jgi:3-deoxy-manno-octulosonate cytidylyltransferase (CMP-KDO synthetase)
MITIGIIPARYASTRFPGKPLADINGKPMIQRVYEQVSKIIPDVCVATDDKRIEEVVKNFNGNVVMTSTHHESGTDRCAEAVVLYEKMKNIKSDVVINIQGDEPFIDPIQIEQLINSFNKKTEIATLIKKIDDIDDVDNKNRVKVVINKDANALYFSRNAIPYMRNEPKENWLLKHNFYYHIGMYGYKRDILMKICKLNKSSLEISESLEQLRWLENGYSITTSVTQIESIGIDTPDDLAKALAQGKM